jgi:CrcB protein
MAYFLAGLGGACGSLARFALGKRIAGKSRHAFPIGTIIINATGAMLLGFINSLALDKSLLFFLADGFLGAYTTFSAFMYEGFSLFHDRKHLNAAVYISGTVLSGLIFYVIGMLAAKSLRA